VGAGFSPAALLQPRFGVLFSRNPFIFKSLAHKNNNQPFS
jgi:hypothetical protein